MIKKERLIFHVDVNSAFLSWESVHRLTSNSEALDLRTIPSAVGGDKQSRHGIVLAKSTKAKSYGIVTGEPLTQALQKCPSLVVVPPNFEVYTSYSERLMKLLLEYTPTLNQFSIDEAFLDMTDTYHLFGTPMDIASQIRERVMKELGFTVNIGVSTNKLLAKMASDFKKPNLCHSLFPSEISEKMWPLPVEELFFVGKSAKAKFNVLGIRSIYDLAHTDVSILRTHLGNKYSTLIHEYANGIDEEPVEDADTKAKGCGNSITLSQDVIDNTTAKQVLLALSETVGARLRSSNVSCSCITVEIKYTNFQTYTHQTVLPYQTNTTTTIYEAACRLFEEFWDNSPIRLLGIRTTKLDDTDFSQISLFDNKQSEKFKKLDSAIDSIRNKYGNDSVKRASFLKENTICNHKLGKK
ncbi:MAG TPA: DNA polymerase IV [Lachnoclostridium phytofermentans]|uniref:DNA polymerase IV n=1 Tax=Lachnoclostridium phytofermentans TaxID=66219 RepID=A0A3D2XAE6_9FIRM|nr:DNA polymerase IV [Lachnoclostridium sp.]HCL03328.1 DNA polymerase IV [Lachnoclostridium phytofermentans]